jgi:cell division cycle 2-like protein
MDSTVLPASDNWTPSRSIDHYEQLHKIEEGSYGIVYKSRDRATGHLVAIKQLKLDRERQGFPTTSLREISSLLSLKHPNIVNLREVVVGERLGSVYLVMDYVAHDLRSLLESSKSTKPLFQLSEIKTIISQLLCAISFMHQHWIVHRDLKLSNLLIGNDGIIKVADFGLARRVGDPPPSDLTEVVVTLWYRAPELLLGSHVYGAPVDIWSIGCIFGELVLGRPLFPGTGEIDQMDRIVSVLGRPTTAIWPALNKLPHARKLPDSGNQYNLLDKVFEGLCPEGIDLLDRMLTYDPEKRITADAALAHPFFTNDPLPKDPSAFPTWPDRFK